MGEHDELIPVFVAESLELLDTFDQALLALEKDPSQIELLNSIFRTVHSIKGMCGFLHFSILEKLSHAGEDLLGDLRDKTLVLDNSITNSLLKLSDALRTVLVSIQNTSAEGDEQYTDLLEALRSARLVRTQRQLDSTAILQEHTLSQLASPAAPRPASDGDSRSFVSETALRVDLSLLDHLMNLAGELVLARNQILQTTKRIDDPNFRTIVQRLNSVTSELQESVMKTRVQPIASLWDKLPRIVRDISNSTGKTVTLKVSGEHTEVDKSILDAIKDPLIHLLRNAIDHGIEAAENRVRLGKPREGRLILRAFPDGGYVIVELRDDGAGLNTEKIKQQAIARGLLSAKQAEGMSDSQIHRYIFAPGFSTADTVTTLSGRGVGMDVVRSNIESISGQIQIASESGIGTTIRLKIPLSLSIIPTLLVSTHEEMFAIPEAVVTELVKISKEHYEGSVVEAGSAMFLRLRDELLPLLCLRDYLELNTERGTQDDFITIVLSVEGCRFGVMVDHVHNIEEIVVKPLDRQLQRLLLYTGATILGDGRIVLILDPSSMLHHLHLNRPDTLSGYQALALDHSSSTTLSNDSFLIVETDQTSYAAIPVANVRRLEKIPTSALETIGDSRVVQYRGHVVPVLCMAKRERGTSCHQAEMPVVVLCDSLGRELGLHVQQIVDICSNVQSTSTTLNSSQELQVNILDNHSTLMLDVPKLFASVYGEDSHVTPASDDSTTESTL